MPYTLPMCSQAGLRLERFASNWICLLLLTKADLALPPGADGAELKKIG
jgi:hypothetical protein